MRESKKPSAPLYSFGTSVREAEPKKYTTKEMADIDCYGNSTPQGPKYNVTDKFSYGSVPKWKFGTASRDAGDSQPKYEHFYRPDVDVLFPIFSLTLSKQTRTEDTTSATQG